MGEEAAGALFSPCRQYRYRLWRRWDEDKPYVNFLMLNPSTADEVKLDPTCNRCKGFAIDWGYGALVVTNLFAWRATEPDDMKAAPDPVGPDNDGHIVKVAKGAGVLVAAWGNHGQYRARMDQVRNLLKANGVQLNALRINGSGEPSHPLYLPSELKPVPMA